MIMSTRVFLSYARGDDEPFVRRLHDDLKAEGFTVWFDRESLMSRGLTFHQEIKDAIRCEVDRIVYVGGPKAAASPYVREEWQLGLEFDHVVVTPILRLGDYKETPGELSLLHCEDFRDDAKYAAALAKLVTHLRQPNPKLGAIFAVPSLPPHFLARPELMRRVRDALLVDLQTAQVITSADARVGMQGMGGIGKSVLAAALARNRGVRQSYPDGIAWISFGQNLTRDDLLSRLRDLVRHLGGEANFQSLPEGQGVLRELLQAKAVLLVLDDVWRASDAKEFDHLGPRCRMLVTTRDAGILHTLHGELVPVSLFTEAEALQLLADAVGVEVSALPAEAKEVADECGLLPLALALSGGMAKKRGGDFHSVLERLRQADLEKIADRESINEAHRSIWRAMQASVEMLSEDEQRRFGELAVFSADDTVPEAAVATLWEHTGSLDAPNTEDFLINLAERSLIQLDQKPDAGAGGGILRRIRLHTLLHDYATCIATRTKFQWWRRCWMWLRDFAARITNHQKGRRAPSHPLAHLHLALLNAYKKKCPTGWASGPDDGYFFQQMRHHLIVLEHWDDLCAYLTDFLCLDQRIRSGQIFEVVTDQRAALAALPELEKEAKREEERVGHCARYGEAMIIYARDCAAGKKPALPEPPDARGMAAGGSATGEVSPRADRLRAIANFTADKATLLAAFHDDFLPLAANAAADGPLSDAVATLDAVSVPWLHRNPRPPAPALRPQCLATLQGHTNWVTSVALSPDGSRAVSGSHDNTLRVWDLHSGECLATLQGHTRGVLSVALTPDGSRAVSGSGDHTLRVWDLHSGQCLATLQGHTSIVYSVALSPDGSRAVSGSHDKSLRVWDLITGQCLATLEGHSDWVISVALSPDGSRVVSGSRDRTLRLWNLLSGQCIATLQGHTGWITSVALSPDGSHVVSGSWDKTLRVWDLITGQCLATLQGHTGMATSVALSPDGSRAVSGSDDKTLRVWDPASGHCLLTLQGHTEGVTSVALSQDGSRAVSGSSDNTLRVWDLLSGRCLTTLQGHTSTVISVALSADGSRAVSGSSDKNLRVWDLLSGRCLATLQGHTSTVTSVALSPDGSRAVSGSSDKTLRVWDLHSGQCLATLQGHTGLVTSVALYPDGSRAVSGSSDNTLRVWDLLSGQCLATLEGHSDWVISLALSPDGSLAVSGTYDKTLRVWDLLSGRCLAIYHAGASVPSIAVSPTDGRIVCGSNDGQMHFLTMRNFPEVGQGRNGKAKS